MPGDATPHKLGLALVGLMALSRAGKTTLVRQAATLCGRALVEVALHNGTDASDLLGGFEQHSSETTGQVRP